MAPGGPSVRSRKTLASEEGPQDRMFLGVGTLPGMRGPAREGSALQRGMKRPAPGTELGASSQINLASLPGGTGWGMWGTQIGK